MKAKPLSLFLSLYRPQLAPSFCDRKEEEEGTAAAVFRFCLNGSSNEKEKKTEKKLNSLVTQ